MAFSSLNQTRSAMLVPLRSLATSAGSPRLASSVTAAVHRDHQRHNKQQKSGGGKFDGLAAKYGPMWAVLGIIGGLVGVAGCIAIHTAKQQLFHSPSVQVSKERRECIPEVDHADEVVKSSKKFLNKSFLRKVGHIQDKQPGR